MVVQLFGGRITVRSPLDQVIQGLSHDPNLPRIKKLLIYSCRQTWETAPNQLSQYDLSCLVQELCQPHASLEHIKTRLYHLVKTLSKPAEYTLIANALIYHLEPLYLENSENLADPATQVVHGWPDYATVAHQLEQDVDVLRVRKLIYAACRQTWENDPAVLSQTPLAELVQELYRLTSTPQTLDAILNGIVCTLNRQVEYRQIAQRIAIACSSLYPSHAESTQSLLSPAAPTPSPPAASVPTGSLPLPSPTHSPVSAAISPPAPSNLFDLRLEIMKYANPLRAKVLLFSVLHGSMEYTSPMWDMLKAEGLDELLSQLFHQYPIFAELQTKLPSTAQRLPERDTYSHVSDVILRAIKPCYPNGRAIAVQPIPTLEAEFTQADRREITGITHDQAIDNVTSVHVSGSTNLSAETLP